MMETPSIRPSTSYQHLPRASSSSLLSPSSALNLANQDSLSEKGSASPSKWSPTSFGRNRSAEYLLVPTLEDPDDDDDDDDQGDVETGVGTEDTSDTSSLHDKKWSVFGSGIHRRLVRKNGEFNIVKVTRQKYRLYLVDIFTTLVDMKWRWLFIIFMLSFLVSWFIYGVIWYLIAYLHGDTKAKTTSRDSPSDACVPNIHSLATAFIFSLETQYGIGGGSLYVTDRCPEAIIVLCSQAMVGVLLEFFMVGVMFTKFARPKKRAQTVMFSKNAVICTRDGQLCLLFRVGDMRKSHIVEVHAKAQLILKKMLNEGEAFTFHQFDIDVSYTVDCTGHLNLMWPLTLCHEITPESPFWEMSSKDFEEDHFEIIIILEGAHGSTGAPLQTRTSYLSTEILWGHRFTELVTYEKKGGECQMDYSRFNDTYPVDMPTCSAKDLVEKENVEGVTRNDKFKESLKKKKSVSTETLRSRKSQSLEGPSPIRQRVEVEVHWYGDPEIRDTTV